MYKRKTTPAGNSGLRSFVPGFCVASIPCSRFSSKVWPAAAKGLTTWSPGFNLAASRQTEPHAFFEAWRGIPTMRFSQKPVNHHFFGGVHPTKDDTSGWSQFFLRRRQLMILLIQRAQALPQAPNWSTPPSCLERWLHEPALGLQGTWVGPYSSWLMNASHILPVVSFYCHWKSCCYLLLFFVCSFLPAVCFLDGFFLVCFFLNCKRNKQSKLSNGRSTQLSPLFVDSWLLSFPWRSRFSSCWRPRGPMKRSSGPWSPSWLAAPAGCGCPRGSGEWSIIQTQQLQQNYGSW